MTTATGSIVKAGTLAVEVPPLDAKAQAAKTAIEHYTLLAGTIDCEENKIYVDQVLTEVKTQLRDLKAQEKSLTDPLVNIRRDALSVKQGIENLHAPAMQYLETGERILKDGLLKYHNEQVRKRVEAEAEARRQAEREARVERDRLQAEADRIAAEATERARVETEEAARLRAEADRAATDGHADVAENLRRDAALTEIASNLALEDSAAAILTTMERHAEVVAEPVFVVDTSVKIKGSSIVVRWVSEIVDLMDVLAGIAIGETPAEALRVRVNGKLVPCTPYLRRQDGTTAKPLSEIEGVEINMPFFNEKATQLQKQFSYRGMTAKEVSDLRKRV